jgi:chromosome segregation ATPase
MVEDKVRELTQSQA